MYPKREISLKIMFRNHDLFVNLRLGDVCPPLLELVDKSDLTASCKLSNYCRLLFLYLLNRLSKSMAKIKSASKQRSKLLYTASNCLKKILTSKFLDFFRRIRTLDHHRWFQKRESYFNYLSK